MVRAGIEIILFLAITSILIFITNARDSIHFIQAVQEFFPDKFQLIMEHLQVIGIIVTETRTITYMTSTTMVEVCKILVDYEIQDNRGMEGESENVIMLPATEEQVKNWNISKLIPDKHMKPSFYVICERPSTIFPAIHVAVFCRKITMDAWDYYGGEGSLQADCWGSKAVVGKNQDFILMDHDKMNPSPSNRIDDLPENVDPLSLLKSTSPLSEADIESKSAELFCSNRFSIEHHSNESINPHIDNDIYGDEIVNSDNERPNSDNERPNSDNERPNSDNEIPPRLRRCGLRRPSYMHRAAWSRAYHSLSPCASLKLTNAVIQVFVAIQRIIIIMGIFSGCKVETNWDPHDTLKRGDNHGHSSNRGSSNAGGFPKRSKSLDMMPLLNQQTCRAAKKKVDKNEIGLPTNFQHTGHLERNVLNGKVDPDQIKRQLSQVGAKLNIPISGVKSEPSTRVSSPVLMSESEQVLHKVMAKVQKYPHRKHQSMRIPAPPRPKNLENSQNNDHDDLEEDEDGSIGSSSDDEVRITFKNPEPYVDPFEAISKAMEEPISSPKSLSNEAPWKVHGKDDWSVSAF